MATEVIMPKVDMVMETGELLEWLKKEGDAVRKGDPLFVISTDKAAIEVEAPADGFLAGVNGKVGDVIPVTQVIAYILGSGESLPGPAPVPTIQPHGNGKEHAPSDVASVSVEAPVAVNGAAPGKIRASPVARRVARELGLDLALIKGRGPRGRIHKADLIAYQDSLPCPDEPVAEAVAVPVQSTSAVAMARPTAAEAAALPVVSTSIPLPDARQKQVIPLAGARKIIAERMAYSAATIPQMTLSLRVDMTETVRLRERVLEPIQKQTGQRVSYTAILARAVAAVLPRHPALNASIAGDKIIYWEDVHLGIATSVDENLIVPVIREAQTLSLGTIVAKLADLSTRARSRHLAPTEMTGSTFTISNLGMYGVEHFTAIVNPPEAAILAVGKMVDTPVFHEGQFVLRPMIDLTVSADHRITDGAEVAQFLADLKSVLENPYLLV